MLSIQNNKQYPFELTGNLGCLEFLVEYKRPECSEIGPVLTGLWKYDETYLVSQSPGKVGGE